MGPCRSDGSIRYLPTAAFLRLTPKATHENANFRSLAGVRDFCRLMLPPLGCMIQYHKHALAPQNNDKSLPYHPAWQSHSCSPVVEHRAAPDPTVLNSKLDQYPDEALGWELVPFVCQALVCLQKHIICICPALDSFRGDQLSSIRGANNRVPQGPRRQLVNKDAIWLPAGNFWRNQSYYGRVY